MTLVSDDPSWWPLISYFRTSSYVYVAASTILVYDWMLTLGQEIDLIWGQRWSLVTVLYLSVRYAGIPFSLIFVLETVSMTDTGCMELYLTSVWVSIIMNALLGVIIITRLYAMFQGSKKILIFVVVTLLITVINNGVTAYLARYYMTAVEAILDGTRQCGYNYNGEIYLIAESWIVNTVWEVIALGLAMWTVVNHFRGLPRGWTSEDFFTVLAKSHVFYFAAFAATSGLSIGLLNPNIANSISVGVDVYEGVLQISKMVQMFVLGPHLILSVREYNRGGKLVTDSDEGIKMDTVVFRGHVHESSGGIFISDGAA